MPETGSAGCGAAGTLPICSGVWTRVPPRPVRDSGWRTAIRVVLRVAMDIVINVCGSIVVGDV